MDVYRTDTTEEVSAVAARFVVEEGLDYGAAKRRAGKMLGLSARGPWPDNNALEDAVCQHIALFCADTQPAELRTLRELACVWMERLAAFRPLLGGAVWHGTATRHTDVYVHLYVDDPKSVEWALIDHRVAYHPGSLGGGQRPSADTLSLRVRSEALGQWVLVHLVIHDADDVRGALLPDARGRRPCGGVNDVRALLEAMPHREGTK
jgi:hypothetical protein